MTTASAIEAYLGQYAPMRLKMDFDNVGFLIGEGDAAVRRILVALDVAPDVVDEAIAIGAQCIVTHHPVIFKALKRITDNDPHGKMIIRMIKSGIAAVCMHTNLDLVPEGVNEMLARKLGLSNIEVFTQKQMDPELGLMGLGRVGLLPDQMEPLDLCAYVRSALGSNGVRYVPGDRPVRRLAVAGGHCGDLFPDAARAGCEGFVTSDVSYDEFLDAKALGLTLIDAGHYPTENVIVPLLAEWLQKGFPDTDVQISNVHAEAIQYL